MRFFLLFCLTMLSACAGNLAKLRDQHPSADTFNSALAAEYLAYGDSEYEQGRAFTGEYYAGKGLAALRGEAVAPEEPGALLPDPVRDELAKGRALLLALLNEDMKRIAPQPLARAQLLYDCWQHQMNRGLSQERAPCGDEFRSAVIELQTTADLLYYNHEETHEASFLRGSARMTASAAKKLAEMAQETRRKERYLIELQAVFGAKAGLAALAGKRLESVQQALEAQGIRKDRIVVQQEDDSQKVYLGGEDRRRRGKVLVTVKTHEPARDIAGEAQ